jgi:hypothetical protein
VTTDAKVYAMVDDLARVDLIAVADAHDIPGGAFSIGSPMLRQWIKAKYEAGTINGGDIVARWSVE